MKLRPSFPEAAVAPRAMFSQPALMDFPFSEFPTMNGFAQYIRRLHTFASLGLGLGSSVGTLTTSAAQQFLNHRN